MKHFTILIVFFCLCLVPCGAFAAKSGEVIVYNWSDYIPEDVLRDFTKETGIKVVYTTYESNEAMYAKVKMLKGAGYDVICPSTYVLEQMITDKLVRELDHSKLPNMGNVEPRLMNLPFDQGNRFSMPYMWGSYGIIVNTRLVKEPVTSWQDLLRPEFKNRIMLYDDPRMTFGMALLATGSNPNSQDEAEIQAAYEFLQKVRPNVRVFDVSAASRSMVSEEASIGAIWNGDGQLAMYENPDLSFVYPKEGVVVWLDNFAITSGAENVNNAHAFINYMLRPEVAIRCLEEYGYSTANRAALELMNDELRNNHLLNPTADDLKNSVIVTGVGKAQTIYNKYWERLLANIK